jgi:hypothetical protein
MLGRGRHERIWCRSFSALNRDRATPMISACARAGTAEDALEQCVFPEAQIGVTQPQSQLSGMCAAC